ncbi:hypothetical protein DFR55_105100 [Herbinix hemicellulosilytica]|uniref:Putative membrane protein n=1 Tax=Herbinix hemicellulosilytica TaxID=1564487 RepID=A0A0H5SHW6_HERHM|nr:hypothetical protein [Herbinix hemicellulosilytica]RBP59617.1 hypothetical protein DFR55_105100 [Herbinix hemicellulosilytica]CRZ34670.1 putative membrane protein [Herbinix hemicellulosilytica]
MDRISKEREKQLSVDLWIILLTSVIALGIYTVLGNNINKFIKDDSVNIILRVLSIGVFQFGVAGLGSVIVSIIRKDSFLNHGLNTKNLIKALVLSLVFCIPEFAFRLYIGEIHKWVPFIKVNTTAEILSSGFPWNVLGMLITATCWGFFEGFNYVIIRDKLSELMPSKYKYFDWGALICALVCILIHGMIGITPKSIIEMTVTMFLIYGMLIVRKITGNAWGCVLVFLVYWNAFD